MLDRIIFYVVAFWAYVNILLDDSDFDDAKNAKRDALHAERLKQLVPKKPSDVNAVSHRMNIDPSVALPLYAVTILPGYEQLHDFVFPLRPERIITTCISKSQIVHNAVRTLRS